MEAIEITTPYTNPKYKLQIINSKKYELRFEEEYYSLIMDVHSNNKLYFILRVSDNLSIYQYIKEYKYEELLNLLALDKKSYPDLNKIFILFDKAFINKKVDLAYNKSNKTMILKVKKESGTINVELNQIKLTNEEKFIIAFEEISLIKSDIKERGDNNYKEIINNLMKKNKENEELIKDLQKKIINLENTISRFKDYIDEKNNINMKGMNNNTNNNKQDELKENYLNQMEKTFSSNNQLDHNKNKKAIIKSWNYMNNNKLNLNELNDLNPLIIISFRDNDVNKKNLEPVIVKCTPDEKISVIIGKYRNKRGYQEKKLKFIYNGKELNNPNLSVNEVGITSENVFNSIIVSE